MPTVFDILIYTFAGFGFLVFVCLMVVAGLLAIAMFVGHRRRRDLDAKIDAIANMAVSGPPVDRAAPTKPEAQPTHHDAVPTQARH